MANALYAKFKEALLGGGLNLPSDSIKVVGVTASYTPNMATDQYLTALGANTVGTAQTLTSKTVTGGTFDCANPVFPAVASGPAMQALVYYKDTGTASTSPLIAYVDTGTNLPITPNGGDIDVTINASGVFSL